MANGKTKVGETRPRFKRLEARVTSRQKALIEKASALAGRTPADFIVHCAVEQASRLVSENDIIKLGERDQRVFVEALLNPPPPNKALRQAAQRHAALIGEDH